MKIYKLKVLILSAFVMLTSQSCDFGDTNIDPESLLDSKLNLLLPSAIAQTAFNNGAVASRNAGIVMQYFEGIEAQQLAYTSYNMPDNVFNNLWRGGLYGGAMKDLDLIIKKAKEEKAPHYSGIAKILMASSLGLTTSFFGDIPYSEAFKGSEGKINPKYDTQEKIFATIFSLLSDGIKDLQKDKGVIVPSSDDYIFGGDAKKWVATAYALEARYALMMSKKGKANYSKALTALSKAIQSNASSAVLNFEGTANGANPLFQFHRERSNTIKLSSTFLGKLKGDPRLSKILTGSADKGAFAPGTYWGNDDSPVSIISYPECLFIKAEAQKATGASDATVLSTLKSAVKASMQQMGISSGDITSYIARLKSSSVETIINEKYIGVFPLPIAWDDYRRTGFPTLVPNKDNDEGLNPGGAIPRRFIYPTSEKNYNKTSLDVAVKRQGGALMNQVLWVFK